MWPSDADKIMPDGTVKDVPLGELSVDGKVRFRPTVDAGPRKRRRRWLLHAATLSALAFVLHLVWESVQCPIFFVHGSYDASPWGMVTAALGDVLLTWIIYGVVAAISRRWRWAGAPWSWGQIAAFIATAFALAVGVELHAQATERWLYRGAMPVLPILDVGVIPVLQLLILTPIVVLLAERITARRGAREGTDAVRQRYDRVAPIYDLMEWVMELRFRGWRRDLWALVAGDEILELGVGTGKNLRFHPLGKKITAIDISEKMLRRARRRAARLGQTVTLQVADAQALPFADASFDEVVATFLFCSVPDAVAGLREERRVLRPGGRLRLLEHVLSKRPVWRRLMRWFDPIPSRLWGAHIDRETLENLVEAGFEDIESSDLWLDIFKRIAARAPSERHPPQRSKKA